MQPTQNPVTDQMVTRTDEDQIPGTLRSAALYLSRYGWVQGSYYDPAATVFTPAACTVGAIGMVCYGGPVEAPAQMFDEPGFAEFEAAVAYLERVLYRTYCQDVYAWNDSRARTAGEVIRVLTTTADTYSDDSTVDGGQ